MKKLIFFLILGLFFIKVYASDNCGTLSCDFGQVCYYNESTNIASCKDACFDNNNLSIGYLYSCTKDKTYCDANNLIRTDKCDICGCPSNHICDIGNTNKCILVCQDGTLSDKGILSCSQKNNPMFCQQGVLVPNSQLCGCSGDKIPQSDGTCGYGASIQISGKKFETGNTIGLDFIDANNIAPFAIVNGSSVNNLSLDYEGKANRVNDFDYYYAWISNYTGKETKDDVLEFQWDTTQEISEVRIIQAYQLIKNYKVQYYKDNLWVDITNKKSLKYYPQDYSEAIWNKNDLINGKLIEERVEFSKIKTNKLRVLFQCSYNCAILEIEILNNNGSGLILNGSTKNAEYTSEIYNTMMTQNTTQYANLELNYTYELDKTNLNIAPFGRPIASSTLAESWVNLNAINNLVDYESTVWVSRTYFNEWVGLEWDEKKKITKIEISSFWPVIPCFTSLVYEYYDNGEWKIIKQSKKGRPNDYGLMCNSSGGFAHYPTKEYKIVERFSSVYTDKIRVKIPSGYGYITEIKVYEDYYSYKNLAPLASNIVASSSARPDSNVNLSYLNDLDINTKNFANIAPYAIGIYSNLCHYYPNNCLSSYMTWLSTEKQNTLDYTNDKILFSAYPYKIYPEYLYSPAILGFSFNRNYFFYNISIYEARDRITGIKILTDFTTTTYTPTVQTYTFSAGTGDYYSGGLKKEATVTPYFNTNKFGYVRLSMLTDAYNNLWEAETIASVFNGWRAEITDLAPQVYYEFSSPQKVSGIKLFLEANVISDYEIIYFENGIWKTISTPNIVTDNTYNKVITYDFTSNITTDKIGIKILSSSEKSPLIKEFEVRGFPEEIIVDESNLKVKVQLRSSNIINGTNTPWTNWIGPDGTQNSFYESSDIPISVEHQGDKLIQFKAIFESNDEDLLTKLEKIKFSYTGTPNNKPLIKIKDYELNVNQVQNFSVIANDIGGHIINYSWNLGDSENIYYGENISHSYNKAGGYSGFITVIDNDGINTTANFNVYVNIFDCLTPDVKGTASGAQKIDFNDPVIEQAALNALLEYANKKKINLNDIDTVVEYYEAANMYITSHTIYTLYDEANYEGVAATKLFKQSYSRGCGKEYCGDCEDYAIMTTSLLRAMGINNKCIYTVCSRDHCWNVLNINSKYRFLEPQKTGLTASYNSKSYESLATQNGITLPTYALNNLFNDHVGTYYVANNANPVSYTLNYPGSNGLPDTNNVCDYGSNTDLSYYEDICP